MTAPVADRVVADVAADPGHRAERPVVRDAPRRMGQRRVRARSATTSGVTTPLHRDAVVDEGVAARFRAGDPDAVRVVYRTYAGLVFGVAFKALGDRTLAEEATQETFLRAWKAARSFDPSRSLAPWLSTIVRRVAIDLHRRESRRPHESLDSGPETAEGGGLTVDRAIDVWEVRDALAQLPHDEQEVMRLQHRSGMTHTEIAQRLGIPLGTVKSRSFRAHRQLRALLGHEDQPQTVGPAGS